MELTTFATLNNTDRFAALATMTNSEINALAMAAEKAADEARYGARDSSTVGIMTLVAQQVRGESRRRFVPAKVAKPFTGCVAKDNGRWIAW